MTEQREFKCLKLSKFVLPASLLFALSRADSGTNINFNEHLVGCDGVDF